MHITRPSPSNVAASCFVDVLCLNAHRSVSWHSLRNISGYSASHAPITLRPIRKRVFSLVSTLFMAGHSRIGVSSPTALQDHRMFIHCLGLAGSLSIKDVCYLSLTDRRRRKTRGEAELIIVNSVEIVRSDSRERQKPVPKFDCRSRASQRNKRLWLC